MWDLGLTYKMPNQRDISVRVDGIDPSVAIENPANALELSSRLEESSAEGHGVIPIGGGTRLTVGGAPSKYDIALNIGKLNSIVSHNPADLTCTVEAGITLENLRSVLSEHGQFLAIDSPFPDQATVGGVIASNAPGFLKWQLAHPRDSVIGMEVALPNGTLIKSGGQVVKNVSGYDMARLHIGAFGNLGVITKVSFKLNPKPVREATLDIEFDEISLAYDFAQEVYKSYVMPLSLICSHDFEKSSSGCKSLVRIGGRERALKRQIDLIREIGRRNYSTSIEIIDQPESDRLWIDVLNQTVKDVDSGEYIKINTRSSCTPSEVEHAVRIIGSSLENTGSLLSINSEPGFGAIFCTIRFPRTQLRDESIRVIRKLRESLHEIESWLIVEDLPVEWKSALDVWDREQISSIKLMESLKATYDPDFVLSPGRFVTFQ